MRKFVLLFCVSLLSTAFALADTIVIASYNLRNANAGDSINGNGWGQRCPRIARLIQFHGFDIFGTQEGKYHQLEELMAIMPGYDYIGVGRDDGKQSGEYSAIFYRKDKFELLEHGDFWLSTVMDRPNVGWDAALPRLCTWGKFKVKQSGKTFLFFNLHMDHIGVKARAESAKLILKKIKEQPAHIPVVLTGDFNVDERNESYKLLQSSNVLFDAYASAESRYAPTGTFNDFHPDYNSTGRIDHIFLTKDFNVMRYGVLTDSYRIPLKSKTKDSEKEGYFSDDVFMERYELRMPSDHFPVMIVVDL